MITLVLPVLSATAVVIAIVGHLMRTDHSSDPDDGDPHKDCDADYLADWLGISDYQG